MKFRHYLAIIAGFLAGCHSQPKTEHPTHIYFAKTVVVRKYVVEQNYEAILKKIGGNIPQQFLDLRGPVSFPIDPDVWKTLVDRNAVIIAVKECPLHFEIEIYPVELLEAYERSKH